MRDESCDLLCLDLARAEGLRRDRRSRRELASIGAAAAALGDPTRLAIAEALLREPALCGCDLAWIIERSPALVSHHVRVLREAGLLESQREGKMVMHSLSERGRRLLAALVKDEVAVA